MIKKYFVKKISLLVNVLTNAMLILNDLKIFKMIFLTKRISKNNRALKLLKRKLILESLRFNRHRVIQGVNPKMSKIDPLKRQNSLNCALLPPKMINYKGGAEIARFQFLSVNGLMIDGKGKCFNLTNIRGEVGC